MAEEAPKALPNKIAGKFGDKLTDRAVEKTLDWVVRLGLGGAVFAFIRSEWACITQPWCTVSGSSLGVLISVTVLTTSAGLFFANAWFRMRRELHAVKAEPKTSSRLQTPRFQPIAVEDRKLMLRWYIRQPPHEWRHWRDIENTVYPQTVQDVVDGPFHAKPKCNAPVKVHPDTSPSGNHPPFFDARDHCSHCGDLIFTTPTFSEGPRVAAPAVRIAALLELQRMEREGTQLENRAPKDPPIVLEKPGYWNLMLPPTDSKP
jgi:hypothetical protein